MHSHRLLLLALALSVPGARAEPAVLAVQVLGSGGPRPSARASSGTLVLVAGVARLLVDAGPGTLLRAGEQGVDLSGLDTVLLTHLHTDHSVELPSFATVRSLDGSGRTRLRIVGPDGNAEFPSTRAFVSGLLGPKGLFRSGEPGGDRAAERVRMSADRGWQVRAEQRPHRGAGGHRPDRRGWAVALVEPGR